MGVNIMEYLEVELNPLVYPENIDGRYFKNCELPSCGARYEVDSKGRGRNRYCPDHIKEVKKAKQRARAQKYTGRECVRCKERKPMASFPDSTNKGGRKMETCFACIPFYRQWTTRYLPKCGVYPKKLGGSVFVATCPLYDLCLERMMMELWLPCASPSRSDFMLIHNLDDNEYLRALELLEVGFGVDGQIENQGLRYWLNEYEGVLNAE